MSGNDWGLMDLYAAEPAGKDNVFRPAHTFLITGIKVYPTAEPERARVVEPETQTIKLKAIRREQLERRGKP